MAVVATNKALDQAAVLVGAAEEALNNIAKHLALFWIMACSPKTKATICTNCVCSEIFCLGHIE